MHRHHYHSPQRRALYSSVLIMVVVVFGTVSIHFLEGFSYVDSFFFTSMIATGQGPGGDVTPHTIPGKIFASILAFISAGTLLAALGFLFGPLLGKLFRVGVIKFEEETEALEKIRKAKKG